MGDVSATKIQHGSADFYDTANNNRIVKSLPIIHVDKLKPFAVIAVKMKLTDGGMEHLLNNHNWVEGRDYVHFG
jgi:hypothetical protein